MGSTRLPGKVMKSVAGEPMLSRILERLEAIRQLDEIVVATTADPSDDEIEAFCSRRRVRVYRGSVNDLAARLLGAAESVGADVVVRVWGDCPFIDSDVISAGLESFFESDVDYLTNSVFIERTYPAGLDFEVYRVDVLRDVLDESQDPFHRTCPGEYVVERDAYTVYGLRNDQDLSCVHLTVDYPADLELATRIYASLGGGEHTFGFEEVVDLLRNNPDWTDDTEGLPRNVEYTELKDDPT